MAKRHVSYNFLTMGGRRFVQLTPERFGRLSSKEQTYIETTARYTGEDIREITREDWEGIKDAPGAWQRMIDITTGRVAIEAMDTLSTNYSKGLEWMGRPDLAVRFKGMYNALQQAGETERLAFIMKHELPSLFLYYKDKGKSHVKRQDTFEQQTAEDQIEEFERAITRLEEEYDEMKK